MQPHIPIKMTAGVLAGMTDEQFHALRDDIAAVGHWDRVAQSDLKDGYLRVSGGEYLGVYLPGIFIGIEKDGYTYS